ncbi:hypothetical protein WA026_011795 [Henosepilachna vigintioctopunctata]|uniref:Uncharacterized protein n=1 Tax=Henosepilachna vigintioctopunctata TaxID=420089 RepID=A0AAW1UH88_9CUCU
MKASQLTAKCCPAIYVNMYPQRPYHDTCNFAFAIRLPAVQCSFAAIRRDLSQVSNCNLKVAPTPRLLPQRSLNPVPGPDLKVPSTTGSLAPYSSDSEHKLCQSLILFVSHPLKMGFEQKVVLQLYYRLLCCYKPKILDQKLNKHAWKQSPSSKTSIQDSCTGCVLTAYVASWHIET